MFGMVNDSGSVGVNMVLICGMVNCGLSAEAKMALDHSMTQCSPVAEVNLVKVCNILWT